MKPAGGIARAWLGTGVVLAVLLALLFWRALFQDRILAPTDLIFETPFFADVVPAGFSGPSNPLLYDQVYQFAPWRRFAREALLGGHLPLWNPHSLAGTPFVATQQTAVFSPLNLLLLAVPYERTFVVSAVLRLWIAGMLTFLLARRLGLSPPAGLVAAVAFMLSGFLVVGIGHPHTGVAIWLPGIALAAELTLAARTRDALLRSVALVAVVIGVQFTGGHLETSADMLFGIGLYTLIRWLQLRRSAEGAIRGRRLLLALVAGLLLGTGIAATQLFPFLEWLRLSEEAVNRAAAKSFVLYDPGVWKNLWLLPLFVFPNIYNRPTWDLPYFNFLPWGHNYHSDILYVGVLPFLLAIVALVRCWGTTPVVRAWGIVGLITMARALQLPLFDWINQLPLLELGKAHMLRLLGSFSVCVLAGFGVDALFAAGKPGDALTSRLWRGLCAGVVTAGVALMLVGKLVLPAQKWRLIEIDRGLAENFRESIGGGPSSAASLDREARRMAQNTIMAFRLRNVAMYAPAGIAAAALLLGWVARRRGWSTELRGALLVLAAGDQLGYAWGYNPTISRSQFYPAPPIVGTLASDTTMFRFAATRRDLGADAHMMFGLSDLRGLDFPTRWYATYAKLVPEHVRWRKITFDGYDSPLLRVLNLKYVFAEQDRVPLAAERVARVTPTARGRLWEVRHPQPRSFMVYEAREVGTDAEAGELLQRDPEAVFTRVLLPTDQGRLPRAPAEQAEGRAEVSPIEYSPQRSAWRVRTNRAGYIFTGDAYYPGWKAQLDGRPTTLYRANIAFRAVHVPAGEHVIVHEFEPFSVRIGLAIAALSLILVGSLLIAARPRQSGSAPASEKG